MNWQDILQHQAFYVVGAVLGLILVFWIFKAVIRFALILLIVGFLIWHFWLS
jgi:multisubunit Na+/H+ antiporter MnhG subunit